MKHDHPTSVMLFSAGLGTRMGPLTENRPKPLIQVAGAPLLDRALGWIRDADIDQIVVNLHYKAEMIKDHLAGENIMFSAEIETLLETGGGLRQALPLLGRSPVFTMNPDAVWCGPNPLTLLRQAWRPQQMDGLLMLIPQQNARSHAGGGDFMLEGTGRIARGAGYVYSGVQIIRTDRLAAIEKTVFSLNLLWDDLLLGKRLYGLVYPGGWCDVGTPQGIEAAEKMLIESRDV